MFTLECPEQLGHSEYAVPNGLESCDIGLLATMREVAL